jgi:AraC-like DNA-binding protein
MQDTALLVYYSAMLSTLPSMPNAAGASVAGADRSALETLEAVDVHVLDARRVALTPANWNHPILVSSHWRLYQHDATGGVLRLDSGDFPLAPSTVYLIPPRVSFGTGSAGYFRQFYVHFEIVGSPGIALDDLFTGPVAVPASPAFEAAVGEVGALAADRNAAGAARRLSLQYSVRGVVYQALGRFVATLSEERVDIYRGRLSALRPVLPAVEEIRARIGERLPNAELARLCFLSEDHFIRRFRDALGRTPAQYIAERRVALAARRLLFTGDSLEEIAESVGFRNRFYFSRVFARETGIPPALYRRRGPV